MSSVRFAAIIQCGLAACVAAFSTEPATQPLAMEWAAVPKLISSIRRPDIPNRDFSIAKFGAIGDGHTDSLPAIKAAIAACSAAGGGRVVIPGGEYLVNGPIHLQSHLNLYVSEGATLRFGARPEDYLPLVLTRWEGTLLYNYSPLIYARGAVSVAITGAGVIDGNARAGFASWLAHQTPAQTRLRQMGTDGTPVEQRRFGEGCFLRPSCIQLFECKDVLVEGVTVKDSPFWVVHPVFCTNVTVRGVTVDSLTLNNDGCDPDSCTNVLIEDCTFHTGDDGIAIKAGRDADAWRDGRPCSNIVIRRCRFQSKINGLCIGSEMSAGVRSVFMEDCQVEGGESCIYFKSNRDRGGFIENVRVRNIRIDTSRSAVIRFETNYHSYRGGNAPTKFNDFVVTDISCRNATAYFLFVDGSTDAPISNVRLERISVEQAKEPLLLRHTDALQLIDVKVNGVLLPEHPVETPADAPRLKIKM